MSITKKTSIDTATITLSDATGLTYDGTEKTVSVSSVTLSDGTTTLTSGTDYTVSGTTSATNAGTYTLTVTGAGDYTGTATTTWTIAKADLSSASIDDVADVPYTGSDIKPTPTVTLGGKPLTAGTDFTYSYAGNRYVGTATITVTGTGNYEKTRTKTFCITAAGQTPTITSSRSIVKGGTLDLSTLVTGAKGDVSFTIASGDAATLGTDGKTLTAKSDTTGDVKITVTITAKDENDDDTNEYKAYTGTEAITVTVTNKEQDSRTLNVTQPDGVYGETLPTYTLTGKPSDAGEVTVAYCDSAGNKVDDISTAAAGKYEIIVMCENATTQYAATDTFTIAKKNISGATVTLDGALTYTGESQTQTVSNVTVGETDILSYCDVTGNTQTNAGTYTLTVTAKEDSNYTGSKTQNFTIAKASISATVDDIAAVTYNGSAQEPTVTVKNGETTLDSKNYTVTYSNNTNAGTATVTVDAAENGNYSFDAVSKNFTINKATYTGTTTAAGSAKYGASGTVDLSALIAAGGKVGSIETKSSDGVGIYSPTVTDGVLSFTLDSDSTKAGKTGTVTVPIRDCTNYKDYNITVTLTVNEKDVPSLTANDITATYTGNEVPATAITGTATVSGTTIPGTWSFKDTAPTDVADSKDYTIVFTPTDTVNYASAETTITVTINKAKLNVVVTCDPVSAAGTKLEDVELYWTLSNGTTPVEYDGGPQWNDDGATEVTQGTAYSWTFYPEDAENYEQETGTLIPWPAASSGGGGSSGGGTTTYTPDVEKTEGGSVELDKTTPKAGDKVTVTPKADEGKELEKLTVTDENGNEIPVTDNGDGTFSFTQPNGKVTVEATFKDEEHECRGTQFTDVDITQYYHEALDWAIENGITEGTSDTTFSPNESCTRAQAVTFLWRAAGSPEPAGTDNPFTDVSEDAYYFKAVMWAVENGITNGTDGGTFSPDATCTRAHIVTFLYRAAGSPAVSGSAGFSDVAEDAWYAAAVAWAVENGITNGTSADTFSPDDFCTRAQIVTFLYRNATK